MARSLVEHPPSGEARRDDGEGGDSQRCRGDEQPWFGKRHHCPRLSPEVSRFVMRGSSLPARGRAFITEYGKAAGGGAPLNQKSSAFWLRVFLRVDAFGDQLSDRGAAREDAMLCPPCIQRLDFAGCHYELDTHVLLLHADWMTGLSS